ncbi:MAG: AI-2E family transporter [Chloroflexota bacterium]|nr:AI-2E family transporter [Chloroflexota bacterium]
MNLEAERNRAIGDTTAVAPAAVPVTDGLADDPTPIPISRRAGRIIAVGVVVVVVLIAWAAPVVPRLLITGAALALVLSFPVRLLSRILPRGVAIAIVVIGLLLLLLIALVVLIPVVILQLTDLIDASTGYANEAQAFALRNLERLQTRGWLAADPEEVLNQLQRGALERGQQIGESLLANLLNGLAGALGMVIQFFGVLFIAVYLLADIGRVKTFLTTRAPRRYQDDIAQLWHLLEKSLSRYIGGLLISIALQGLAATLALWLLDVPYAVLLGLWTSATAILPYVGAFLGAIPAILVALFVSPATALGVALVYLAINQIEGNLLTPRIQGEAVKVHPIVIFLGVLAGGEIWGLLGAALAVPVLAVVRVVIEFFNDRLYVRRQGTRPDGSTPATETSALPPPTPSSAPRTP